MSTVLIISDVEISLFKQAVGINFEEVSRAPISEILQINSNKIL